MSHYLEPLRKVGMIENWDSWLCAALAVLFCVIHFWMIRR